MSDVLFSSCIDVGKCLVILYISCEQASAMFCLDYLFLWRTILLRFDKYEKSCLSCTVIIAL